MSKLIRLPQVVEVTHRSKPAIYADMAEGTFPKPIKIGVRAVAWLEEDIQRWIAQRIAATRACSA